MCKHDGNPETPCELILGALINLTALVEAPAIDEVHAELQAVIDKWYVDSGQNAGVRASNLQLDLLATEEEFNAAGNEINRAGARRAAAGVRTTLVGNSAEFDALVVDELAKPTKLA